MPDFVDTNVVVYAFGQDAAKVDKAESILRSQPTISVQVINEFLSVCRVKLGFDIATRHRLASELLAGNRYAVVAERESSHIDCASFSA